MVIPLVEFYDFDSGPDAVAGLDGFVGLDAEEEFVGGDLEVITKGADVLRVARHDVHAEAEQGRLGDAKLPG